MTQPPDYEIMAGCIGNCEHCQIPVCPFDLELLDGGNDPFWGEEDDIEEEICPHTGTECDEDCIACPIIAEDWKSRLETRGRKT